MTYNTTFIQHNTYRTSFMLVMDCRDKSSTEAKKLQRTSENTGRCYNRKMLLTHNAYVIIRDRTRNYQKKEKTDNTALPIDRPLLVAYQ